MVVVINSKEIALPGDEWRKRVYFHHTGYPGGASWTLAWELHNKDPTMVLDVFIFLWPKRLISNISRNVAHVTFSMV